MSALIASENIIYIYWLGASWRQSNCPFLLIEALGRLNDEINPQLLQANFSIEFFHFMMKELHGFSSFQHANTKLLTLLTCWKSCLADNVKTFSIKNKLLSRLY
jgi:hypothetical protein